MTGLLHLLILTCLVSAACAADPAGRPNILYFYVDDMGWGSIGPNGQAERKAKGMPYVRTPNIDALAREGVNFTRGYGCHVCSPARSSQQTGFHQGHTFADRNDPDNAKKAIRADDVTMGDALSGAGYTTGYWGKWGYGGSKNQADPVIQNVQTLPTSHGYQHVLAELHHVRAHTFFQPTLWKAPATANALGGLELAVNSLARYRDRDNYPTSPAMHNHPDYPATAYCDDAYAFAALDFVREQGQNFHQTGQPFFGLFAAQIPHAPFREIAKLPGWDQAYTSDPNFADLSDQSRQWAAMVTRIDAHIGNVLAALDDPDGDGDDSDSIAAQTLVIFQSDNGGPGGDSHDELDSNGGLRGVKGMIQEGGLRVPLVMRWPAKIHSASRLKAGSSTDMIVDVTDLLPTFCELAGVDAPLGIDGVSIAPTLAGVSGQRRRDYLIHEAGNSASIIRGRHKLTLGVGSKRRPERATLHDLVDDPGETMNIVDDHADLADELKGLLLGEHVKQPRGFANTYHRWIGGQNSVTSNADHWTDYDYSNAGVNYMLDDGPPMDAWIADVKNKAGETATAVVDQDLGVLALQISGSDTGADQIVELGPQVHLTARNELRLRNHSALHVNGGQISTLRWVDIAHGALLKGHGVIQGKVFNRGVVHIAGKVDESLSVSGGFRQDADGTLTVSLHPSSPAFHVSGQANLDGELRLEPPPGFVPQPGKPYTILTADKVLGTFALPNHEVTLDDDTRFRITYDDQKVLAVAISNQ